MKIARSYGDLRENFEYKSAKDLEKYLAHRRNALDKEIDNARGTDFKGSDASQGQHRHHRHPDRCRRRGIEMTVLGAWDSDPENKLVSYLSEVGKALVGRAPGDTVQVRDEATELMQTLTINPSALQSLIAGFAKSSRYSPSSLESELQSSDSHVSNTTSIYHGLHHHC